MTKIPLFFSGGIKNALGISHTVILFILKRKKTVKKLETRGGEKSIKKDWFFKEF